ncbi:MAG: hypothetical protein J5634_01530 [Bacilli bacterium]|nr:hypothetical protein [Bacilli bacterium]
MKKFLIYMLIVIIGAAGVYYFLCGFGNKKEEPKKVNNEETKEEEKKEIIPSKDDFVTEAIKLQTLAEDENGADVCKCYNVKELDRNTPLTGSILVYTSGDIYVSSMWLSNGYYYIENSEVVTAGMLDESSEQASIYCGEASKDIQSSLCDVSY